MIAWPTAALLLAIVVLEGARRVSAGDVVFRRLLFGPWGVGELDAERRRWTLVSWLPPVWTTIVAPQRTGPAEPPAGLSACFAAVRPWYRALTVLGTAVLLALVAGIPLAERRSTGSGVLLIIGTVLLLAIATCLVCHWARRRLGLSRGAAWAALSPFAAPYAAERLLDETLRRFSAVTIARALLRPEAFHTWVRPRAYDAKTAGRPDPELSDVVSRDELTAILAPPPAPGDAPLFCPRCGALYREAVECSECEIPLRTFAAS